MANQRTATPTRQLSSGAQARENSGNGVMERYYNQFEETVGDNPASAVMAGFGLGLGIGVLVGCALAGSYRGGSQSYTQQAEHLGRRMLDSISGVIPDSFRK